MSLFGIDWDLNGVINENDEIMDLFLINEIENKEEECDDEDDY